MPYKKITAVHVNEPNGINTSEVLNSAYYLGKIIVNHASNYFHLWVCPTARRLCYLTDAQLQQLRDNDAIGQETNRMTTNEYRQLVEILKRTEGQSDVLEKAMEEAGLYEKYEKKKDDVDNLVFSYLENGFQISDTTRKISLMLTYKDTNEGGSLRSKKLDVHIRIYDITGKLLVEYTPIKEYVVAPDTDEIPIAELDTIVKRCWPVAKEKLRNFFLDIEENSEYLIKENALGIDTIELQIPFPYKKYDGGNRKEFPTIIR